jgi:hypothetical protein
MADSGLYGLWCNESLVHFQVFHRCFHDLQLVGIIVDREVACVVQGLDFAAKQANAK